MYIRYVKRVSSVGLNRKVVTVTRSDMPLLVMRRSRGYPTSTIIDAPAAALRFSLVSSLPTRNELNKCQRFLLKVFAYPCQVEIKSIGIKKGWIGKLPEAGPILTWNNGCTYGEDAVP